MLVPLTQLLNSGNDLLILLALHRDRDRYPTHDERLPDITVLRNRLQVRNFETARRFLQDFSKVLRKEAIETL